MKARHPRVLGAKLLGEGVTEDARRWRLKAAMTRQLQAGGFPPPFHFDAPDVSRAKH